MTTYVGHIACCEIVCGYDSR